MTKKILIADDSRAFRELEGEYLSRRGFSVVYAENGADAMRLAAEMIPDLILLDVQMPVMDGVQVLSFLKKHDHTKQIPVIVITTIKGDKNLEALRLGGADGVLSKPIQGAELLDTVQRFLL